jgi:hypothetical protein
MGGFYMQYLESKSSIDSRGSQIAPPWHRLQSQSHVILRFGGVFFEKEGIPTWPIPHTPIPSLRCA